MATGFKSAWGSLLKCAKIVRFRWYDLRHHFASSLVQIGVPYKHNAVAIRFGLNCRAIARKAVPKPAFCAYATLTANGHLSGLLARLTFVPRVCDASIVKV
jgi:hypothetical protein